MRSLAPIGLIIAFAGAIVLAGPAPDKDGTKARSRACCPSAITQCADRVNPAKGAECPMAKGDCPAPCAECPKAKGDCPCPGGNCADCKGECPQKADCPKANGECPMAKADCPKSGAQCADEGKACSLKSAALQPGTAVMKCGGGTRAIGAARLTSATKCADNRGKRDYLPALQCATYFK